MSGSFPFPVWVLLLCAASLTLFWACAVFGEKLMRLWRSATAAGRTLFVFGSCMATLMGGSKHSSTNGVPPSDGLSACPPVSHLMPTASSLPLVSAQVPVSSADIARGWQLVGVCTNDTVDFALPAGAEMATNWWVHGAYEDVRRVEFGEGCFRIGPEVQDYGWAHVWGRVRPRLKDVSNEVRAVDAPLSAIPGRSRFWTQLTTNDAYLLTWEEFALGRTSCGSPSSSVPFVSAQIELRRNGDFITRSNAVERSFRRVDPDDWDGDGWLNEVDPDPCVWDDIGLPLDQELPSGANEDAYCWIEIESEWNGLVEFVGDGPSDLPDPSFEARAGERTRVLLLIGKTYTVTGACPVSVCARSDERIEIRDETPCSFTVVWPVSVFRRSAGTSAPLLMSPAPLLTGSQGSGGFEMVVSPSGLGGAFHWSTNGCCRIVGNGSWWSFSCAGDCLCGGCSLSGCYAYEGYEIGFSGIECGCRYESDPLTTYSLDVPGVVFRDGALQPLVVEFFHGDAEDPETGTIRLLQTSGTSKVRLWEDEDRTSPATQFEWDVSEFGGCAYYVEGLETSDAVDDIGFTLVWERPGGSSVTLTETMTCAEVEKTDVRAWYPNASPNPPPFAGHTNWTFDVTNSLSPDKHFVVCFNEVSDGDSSVLDFDVDMTLTVKPAGAPVGSATWFALPPTPDSGSVVRTGARTAALRNPKRGGVYHIASAFVGSPTNECNIVLPLAGAEMSGVLQGDLALADGFVSRAKASCSLRWYTRPWFGWKWFCRDDYGFYRGRPDNAAEPTVWYYNQVRDSDGKGAVGTLNGVPIHVEKLSNLIVSYACKKLGVPAEEQELAQLFGTANDALADISWRTGTNLACGEPFDTEIECLSLDAIRFGSPKSERLWPNVRPADNHRPTEGHGDFNYEFTSPGFIYANP